LEDSERVRDEKLGLIEWEKRKDFMGFWKGSNDGKI
jgi:hypothetical protein